jgi:ankyrin repeat protein
MTALMFAAVSGHALAVKALLEGGADIGQVEEVRNIFGKG